MPETPLNLLQRLKDMLGQDKLGELCPGTNWTYEDLIDRIEGGLRSDA